MKLLKKGDRIRLKVRTMFGWKGFGIVTEDQLYEDYPVVFRKDTDEDHYICLASRHEVAKVRVKK